MDDTKLFFREMNNNLIHQDMSDEDRRQKNLRDITDTKMQTMEQFRQNELSLRREEEQGFAVVDQVKNEFYSMDRVQSNVLIIKELIDNANSLRLSPATMEDLDIRRNRLKDFELLNARTKSDSKEMRLLKEEIRNYDLALSYLPNNNETLTAYCKMMEEKCDDVIKRCDDYLKRGKSAKFWKSNRNDRYHLVEEARARYVNEREKIDRLSVLAKAGSAESFLEEGDSMMDLLNIEAIADRMTRRKAEEQQRKEREEARRKEQERKAEKRRKKDINDGMKQAKAVNDLFANEEKQEEEEPEQLVKDLFVGVEDQQQNEQQEEQQNEQQENEHQEQQQNQQKEQHVEQQQQEQQQQQQQKELYGKKELDELEKQVETPELKEVKTAITEIQTKMAQPMPKVAATGNQAADQKAERRARKQKVDKFCAEMIKSFNKLNTRIKNCLKKENSEALKRVLTHLQEYTKNDLTLFKDRVVSYRAWLGEKPEEAEKEHTWRDAWQYVRAVDYDLSDKNRYETQKRGAGASVITEIKDKEKNQTVYFRQNEKVGEENADTFVTNFLESIDGDIKCEADVKDNVKKELEKLFLSLYTDNVRADENIASRLVKDLDPYRKSDDHLKSIQAFIKTDICTQEFAEKFNEASDAVKMEMGKALHLFAKRCFQWSFATHTAKVDNKESLTNRNVATSRLAAVLGISSMVSDSRTAVVQQDQTQMMGNVMEGSRGKEIEKVEGDWEYSNKAIAQSFTLQVFDFLCGQIDRHFRNFHVITKEKDGKQVVNSIKAIDNDMAFGGIEVDEKLYNGYQNICPLTECHIRSMPVDVINNLLTLDKTALQELLGDLIDPYYVDVLADRLNFIQNAIGAVAGDDHSGLTIKADGKAVYENEEADDELRMLKAVKEFMNGGYLKRFDGESMDTMDRFDYNGDFEKRYISLIEWTHLTEDQLNEKIAAREAQLKNGGNQQQGGNQQA
ncbi:MAG: hypothetical protein IJJ13_10635 [Lachnospiraceae bacterium]|nr:hypothetical protein [Lachnospiraceae bacterium]